MKNDFLTTLIALPVLGAMLMLQSAVISQINLMQGSADVVLLALIAWVVQEPVKTAWQWGLTAGLLVSLPSALPFPAFLFAYLSATGVALIFKRIFFERPLLAMFSATLVGTLVIHAITVGVLRLTGIPIPLAESFNRVTLPSQMLNLLLTIPIYAVISDLSAWLHPPKIQI